MTRSRLALLVLILLSCAGRAAAQEVDISQFDPMNWFRPSCPRCGVAGYVDYPKSGATLTRDNILLAGWGFECVSGRAVNRVDVWYEVDDMPGSWLPLKQPWWALHPAAIDRPDVAAAYATVCPAVSRTSGWWLQITNPPPPGARRIMLKLFSGDVWRADIIRTYNFTDTP